jgi:hypothetical protein
MIISSNVSRPRLFFPEFFASRYFVRMRKISTLFSPSQLVNNIHQDQNSRYGHENIDEIYCLVHPSPVYALGQSQTERRDWSGACTLLRFHGLLIRMRDRHKTPKIGMSNRRFIRMSARTFDSRLLMNRAIHGITRCAFNSSCLEMEIISIQRILAALKWMCCFTMCGKIRPLSHRKSTALVKDYVDTQKRGRKG